VIGHTVTDEMNMGARRQLSERQKSFARLVHEQIPPYRAYALAGYRPHPSNPYRLREDERVQQYLSELEAQTMERHEVTVDSLLTELEEARLNAKAAKQPSSEVSAVMGKAKLAGLLVDRQEIKDVSNMNMEELVQAVRDNMGDEAEIVLKALGLKADAGQTKRENQEGEKSVPASSASRNFRLVR
jgi:phage terminase small subunit